MILLPLAENAMKHGPAAGHRGAILCRVAMDASKIRVTLENPGPYAGPRTGSDGLPTVERRLRLAYGHEAALRIAGANGRTIVELELPRGRTGV
jgi:LytS/YehU family sensor histidine kinase